MKIQTKANKENKLPLKASQLQKSVKKDQHPNVLQDYSAKLNTLSSVSKTHTDDLTAKQFGKMIDKLKTQLKERDDQVESLSQEIDTLKLTLHESERSRKKQKKLL